MYESDGNRVQVVELQPAFAPRRYEVSLLEHAKVFHHPEPGHRRQAVGELGERLAITLEEPVEELAPVDVRQGLEHGFHAGMICDHLVTCQACFNRLFNG